MERTRLRRSPGGRSVVSLGRRTEFDSRRVLAVVGERRGWLEVIATERRNGRTGWIRARAVRLSRVDWSIAIHGSPGGRGVGRASSLGCLRARRADLRLLMRRVPLGAPVFLRA